MSNKAKTAPTATTQVDTAMYDTESGKKLAADFEALRKAAAQVEKSYANTILLKRNVLGKIQDMAERAWKDPEYYDALKNTYENTPYATTLNNPASFLIADKSLIQATDGYLTTLRKMFLIAHTKGLTGQELIAELNMSSVAGFITKNNKLLPELEQKSKKPRDKKPDPPSVSPAAISPETVSEPAPTSVVGATLPLSEFTLNLPFEGVVGETVFFNALTLVSGPVVITGNSDRGYFTPTLFTISAATTDHSKAGAEVPVDAPVTGGTGGAGAEGGVGGDEVPEPVKVPLPADAGGAGSGDIGGVTVIAPEPEPQPKNDEPSTGTDKANTSPPKVIFTNKAKPARDHLNSGIPIPKKARA